MNNADGSNDLPARKPVEETSTAIAQPADNTHTDILQDAEPATAEFSHDTAGTMTQTPGTQKTTTPAGDPALAGAPHRTRKKKGVSSATLACPQAGKPL